MVFFKCINALKGESKYMLI